MFVRNLERGTTVRVSVDSTHKQSTGESRVVGLSTDGRVVGFMSFATNLVRGDSNGRRDYFVRVRAPELVCTIPSARSTRRPSHLGPSSYSPPATRPVD